MHKRKELLFLKVNLFEIIFRKRGRLKTRLHHLDVKITLHHKTIVKLVPALIAFIKKNISQILILLLIKISFQY